MTDADREADLENTLKLLCHEITHAYLISADPKQGEPFFKTWREMRRLGLLPPSPSAGR